MASLQGLPPLPKSFRGLLADDGDLEGVIKYGIKIPKDSLALNNKGYHRHESTEYVDMNALRNSEMCESDNCDSGISDKDSEGASCDKNISDHGDQDGIVIDKNIVSLNGQVKIIVDEVDSAHIGNERVNEKIISGNERVNDTILSDNERVNDNSVQINGHRTESGKPIKELQLKDALDKLKAEMASLRQQDLSLLHQLWNLNESIHDLKNSILQHDRQYSDTNSECSSFSLDTGVDSIATIEENEYENHESIYQNKDLLNQGSNRPMSIQEIEEENIYETMYFESRSKPPVRSPTPPKPPPKRRNSKKENKKFEYTGGLNTALSLTCYETNC